MSKKNETLATQYATLKQLSADKKEAKKKLVAAVDAAWAEYKKYVKETYKPARKAAYDAIDAVKKEAKEARAKAKAEKVVAKKTDKVAGTDKIADECIEVGEKAIAEFKVAAKAKTAKPKTAKAKAEKEIVVA